MNAAALQHPLPIDVTVSLSPDDAIRALIALRHDAKFHRGSQHAKAQERVANALQDALAKIGRMPRRAA